MNDDEPNPALMMAATLVGFFGSLAVLIWLQS